MQFDFGRVTEAYFKHGTNKFRISMVLELQSVELNQLQMEGHSKTAKHLNCNSPFCNESNSTAQAHLLHVFFLVSMFFSTGGVAYEHVTYLFYFKVKIS